MIVAARFAYGNARLRGMKSRLLQPENGLALRSAGNLSALAEGLGQATPADPRGLRLERFEALMRDYGKVAASYPRGGALFRALAGLHEIENLKLVWRAWARRLQPWRWAMLWRPIGPLESIRLEDFRRIDSPREAAGLTRGTPYEAVVGEALRLGKKDAVSAELSFDRFASQRLAGEARRLGRREKAARDLALGLVRERDADAVRRGLACGRFAKENARLAAAVFSEDVLPGERLLASLRRQRLRACRMAFLGPPLRLAPAIAYLLLREEEVRAVTSLAEACGGPAPAAALERSLGASLLSG